MNWLLLFVPITIGLEVLSPERYLLIFAASCLAILPLAGWMGRATEQLAERLGEGVGGLLNATFGNAAELIIALAALRAGLYDVVKASIAGSIIGNILLVLGAAMLCGGLRRPEQHFNPAGARSQATMLTLAAIALILPASFQAAAHTTAAGLGRLSVAIAVVLLIAYLLNLIFALVTHAALFKGSHVAEEREQHSSVARAVAVLAAATAAIAWMSEIMVGAIEPTAHELGLSNVFVGVFVVAIMGNAAEHATAVRAAIERPHGPFTLDCHRVERAGGAVRGAAPGAGQPLRRPGVDGSGVPGRPGSRRPARRADHGSGCRRWPLRLAQGRAAPDRLLGARAHLLLFAGQFALGVGAAA